MFSWLKIDRTYLLLSDCRRIWPPHQCLLRHTRRFPGRLGRPRQKSASPDVHCRFVWSRYWTSVACSWRTTSLLALGCLKTYAVWLRINLKKRTAYYVVQLQIVKLYIKCLCTHNKLLYISTKYTVAYEYTINYTMKCFGGSEYKGSCKVMLTSIACLITSLHCHCMTILLFNFSVCCTSSSYLQHKGDIHKPVFKSNTTKRNGISLWQCTSLPLCLWSTARIKMLLCLFPIKTWKFCCHTSRVQSG